MKNSIRVLGTGAPRLKSHGHCILFNIMKYSLKNWYVVQTIANKEISVKNKLEKLKIDSLLTLLPLRKLCIKRKGKFFWDLKSLFPGYFFINKQLKETDIKMIIQLNGVIKILKNMKSPTKVPENEMKLILNMMDKDEHIPESRIFFKNDRVIVKAGPLMNMEGFIISVDRRKKRITVRLPFFNTYKNIQLSFELISKTP